MRHKLFLLLLFVTLLSAAIVDQVFSSGTIDTKAAPTVSTSGHAIIYGTLAEYEAATGKTIETFSEAPALADMVQAGTIPPLEDRLPDEVLVIEPTEEIGEYGGTWRRAWVGDPIAVASALGDGNAMLRWSWDGKEILPNLVTKWDSSVDGKSHTFTLRKGVKWSDSTAGDIKEFTTEDVLFYYNDVMLNEELTPSFPDWQFSIKGHRPAVTASDEYTFTVSYPIPHPTFLEFPFTGGAFYHPAHYAKQYHINYADKDELDKAAKEAGFDHWYQLYEAKTEHGDSDGWWVTNPEMPTTWAWKLIVPRESQQMVYERNPYYWKVDTAGQQLPYIDKVTSDLLQDAEMINLKAMSGELDFQLRSIGVSSYTSLMENRDTGDYRILTWKIAFGSNPFFHLNQTHIDPVLREIFSDVRFRRALSVAINRDEINELVYLGTGEPRQAAIISDAIYYSEEWENAYAQFDPDMANDLLDEMGLDKRDMDGFRLRPDGKTLVLSIDMNDWFPEWTDTAGLAADHWNKVGIKAVVNAMEPSLLWTVLGAGEQMVFPWQQDRSSVWAEHQFWLFWEWSGNYGLYWNSDRSGETGEKPTGDILKAYETFDAMKDTADPAERERLAKVITDLHAENVWIIGTVGETMQPVVVKNNFRNVPTDLISDDSLRSPGNAEPAQFFFKKE